MRSARKASASALHVHSSASGSEDVQVSCDVCGVKGHTAERCWNLTKLSTVSERRSKVHMCGRCCMCLRTLADDQTVIDLFHILLNRNTLTVICHLPVRIMYMLTASTVRTVRLI